MKVPITAKWRGYVRIRIRGGNAERVINALLAKHTQIWDVARTAEGDVTLFMKLPDALRLRPLLKETGCRMKTLERHGMPYSTKMLRQRSFFIAGLDDRSKRDESRNGGTSACCSARGRHLSASMVI